MDERTDASVSWGCLQPSLGRGKNQRSDGYRGSGDVFGHVKHYSKDPKI